MEPGLSPRAHHVVFGIGALVILTQTAERMIGLALETAIPGVDTITLDTMTAERNANAKATLGRLIRRLNERADLDERFERILTSFLDDRNALIHDLDRVPGFDLQSDEGLAVAEAFLFRAGENTRAIVKIFADLMHQWSKQIGGPLPPEEVVRFIGGFEGVASATFFAKPSSSP